MIDEREYLVQLYHSRVSGKKKILINSTQVYEGKQ